MSTPISKPTDGQILDWVRANPHATPDDIRAFANGEIPPNPHRFNPTSILGALGAGWMGAANGIAYNSLEHLLPADSRDFQAQLKSDHPIAYGAGKVAGTVLGGAAEGKMLGSALEAVPGALAKVAQRVAPFLHGGASGAVGGAVAAPDGERGVGAVAGGVVGGITGGVLGNVGRASANLAKDMKAGSAASLAKTILNPAGKETYDLLHSQQVAREATAAPLYKEVLAGKFANSKDPRIVHALEQPEVKAALDEYMRNRGTEAGAEAAAQAAAGGGKVVTSGASKAPKKAIPISELAKLGISPPIPLDALHTIKRQLADQIHVGLLKDKVLPTDRANALYKVFDNITGVLNDETKGAYGAVSAAYGEDSRMIHAFAAGAGKSAGISPGETARALDKAGRYARDIPVFRTAPVDAVAQYSKGLIDRANAGGPGSEAAAQEWQNYALGVWEQARRGITAKGDGSKVLSSPDMRNKLAALAGGNVDAAIQFARAGTPSRGLSVLRAAAWGVARHPGLAKIEAVRALKNPVSAEARQHFVDYLSQGSGIGKDELLSRLYTLSNAQRILQGAAAGGTGRAVGGGMAAGTNGGNQLDQQLPPELRRR